jgi:hypothetical protein
MLLTPVQYSTHLCLGADLLQAAGLQCRTTVISSTVIFLFCDSMMEMTEHKYCKLV